jgi:hypothetical protein
MLAALVLWSSFLLLPEREACGFQIIIAVMLHQADEKTALLKIKSSNLWALGEHRSLYLGL